MKTTDLSQVTDKPHHTMLYTSPWSRFEPTTSAVIGTDCTGSCKSNLHTNTAMMAPYLKIIKCVCTFSHIQNTSFLNVQTGFPTELGTRFSSTLMKCTRFIPRFTMTLRCSKMATRVQIFPSILISKNAHPSNFYSKRLTSYVQETKEKLSATINQFQKNYPVLSSVYTGNNTNNFQ